MFGIEKTSREDGISFGNLIFSGSCKFIECANLAKSCLARLERQAKGVLKMSGLIYLSYLRYKDFLFGITLLFRDVVALGFLNQLVV